MAEQAPADRPAEAIIASETSNSPAKAIASVLGGALQCYENKAKAVSDGQESLAQSLDRLAGELDKLLEDAPVPFIMQHAAKISGIRKRVFALNSMLKTIQGQIDNMDFILSAASAQGTFPRN